MLKRNTCGLRCCPRGVGDAAINLNGKTVGERCRLLKILKKVRILQVVFKGLAVCIDLGLYES